MTKTAEKKLIARTLQHRFGFAPPAASVVLYAEQNPALGIHFEVGGHPYYLRDGCIVDELVAPRHKAGVDRLAQAVASMPEGRPKGTLVLNHHVQQNAAPRTTTTDDLLDTETYG